MSSENNNEINWDEVIGKEALGENGLDFGTIKEISGDYIVTEVGMFNKKIYHLPKTSVKHFNGVFLNFSLNESDLKIYEQKIGEGVFNDSSFSGSPDKIKREEMSIPLISQDLNVTKNITEDNIKITKEPIRESKNVEIELMHENVTIERRDVTMNDNSVDKGTNVNSDMNDTSNQGPPQEAESEDPIYSKIEFLIPVKKEEPVITKKSFVREEVVVKKKPITETKTIAEEITKEEIKYDSEAIEKNRPGIPL
jgi:stress response protein YsnF